MSSECGTENKGKGGSKEEETKRESHVVRDVLD